MNKLSQETIVALTLFSLLFAVLFLSFGGVIYQEYLGAYNTQQDRLTFQKTYEIVLDCRRDVSILNMDKTCGEIPTFVSKVA